MLCHKCELKRCMALILYPFTIEAQLHVKYTNPLYLELEKEQNEYIIQVSDSLEPVSLKSCLLREERLKHGYYSKRHLAVVF